MKTSIKTLVASAMTAIVLSTTVVTAFAAEKVTAKEKVAENMDIKKLVVNGNTKVFIVQSNRDWVSIGDDNQDKVTIKQIGNTLSINSSEETPVVVTVYVKDLYRISAADAADVRTVGTVDLPYLQVIMRDHAKAHIKAKTESLYTDLAGDASLELLGATDSHTIKNASIGNLKTEKLAAVKTKNLPVGTRLAMNDTHDSTKRANEGVSKR
ncbi:GIN domain-containing protein [Pedobacter cryoconitis]|uniref:Putative auto-transporter adhesin head GIN domain-containing protein n=1 Tax=Pedobacter cryoconitis TaxID=188932 RepID=A0A327S0E2_9SPHI|nr:DUF2807 domain-containing protein [Pedobacter cryoconitis]RAJ22419.1 hypothetical protein LY11_04799 [Pedobacter cryoconitis]